MFSVAYLGPSWALWIFRELLNDWVPQQVEPIDDGGCETQHLHTQQVDTVPDEALAQVQRVCDTNVHVEDEGADVEGHGKPAIPVDLCLQGVTHKLSVRHTQRGAMFGLYIPFEFTV